MAASPTARSAVQLDLLRWPLLGRLARWQHGRTALQLPWLLVAALLVIDGLYGPQLAPKNLAGVLPWVQWRGLVVLAILLVGNLFCAACPFLLPRQIAKRWLPADRSWPRRLRNKWLAVALFIAFLWAYEALDLWASPWLTAWLAVAYFVGAFAVDGLYKGAAFCKYLCPIGQFHFINSAASPFEVQVRDRRTCTACTGKHCIAGQKAAAGTHGGQARGRPARKGCELWLFLEQKVGNLDCTFCLDCLRACPYDNVGLCARWPLRELWYDGWRAGVGRLTQRRDLAALALVVVFGAFLNAFGMVAPVHTVERWLAGILATESEAVVLLLIFGLGLIVLPLAAVMAAAWLSRRLGGSRRPLLSSAVRLSFGLVPLGFGMWVAHYGYHFLSGGLTVVPVVQSFLRDLGLPLLGEPDWTLGPLVPLSWLLPLEALCLEVGLLGSLVATWRLAAVDAGDAGAWRCFLPWAVLATALAAASLWLLLQPMEMRGTLAGLGRG